MVFKALHISTLTEEVATNLKILLHSLSGVEKYSISLDTQEVAITFNENQLSFKSLTEEMNKAGCALQNIDAALLL